MHVIGHTLQKPYPNISKLTLTNIFIRLSLTIITLVVTIAPSAHAESNVTGEEIIILPDDASRDFGANSTLSSDNLNLKKPGGNRLGGALDSQLHLDTENQDNVITVESEDLWQRIKNGYGMPNLNSSLVSHHEEYYSARPDYVRRMVERSQKYLFHIVEEIEKRDMPTELALLPMVESAYNPQAYSSSRASGIWQFIPSTGKHFGLKQNWWVDNRRNVVIATDAALDYLQKLYGMFGSWDLALAAYNAGEGTVGRAIERNRKLGLPTDYESINLPAETRNYVPKLQAIKNLMTNPSKYGLKIQTIANTPYFAKVSAPAQIDAHLAAKLAEISDVEFLALNPSANRPVLASNGDKHEILLPISSAQTFRNNLATYNKPLVSWRTYFAKRGESLKNIASKFGIEINQLRSANNLPANDKINKSSPILVPNGNQIDLSAIKSQPVAPSVTEAQVSEIKPNEDATVEEDDVEEISSEVVANQNSANIDLEDTEKLAASAAEQDSREEKANIERITKRIVKHKVKKGETIQSLAKRYKISAKQLMKLNGMKNGQVKVGQSLIVKSEITKTKIGKAQQQNKKLTTSSKKSSVKSKTQKKEASSAKSSSKKSSTKKSSGTKKTTNKSTSNKKTATKKHKK